MRSFIKLIFSEESGQGMVEYSLIIVLVALVTLGGLKLFGNKVSELYNVINLNVS